MGTVFEAMVGKNLLITGQKENSWPLNKGIPRWNTSHNSGSRWRLE